MEFDSHRHDGESKSRQRHSISTDGDADELSTYPAQIDSKDVSPTSPTLRLQHQHYSEVKWKDVQRLYRDSYAELVRREASETVDDGISPVNFDQCQIGTVKWYPYEKESLYQALSKRSWRDLPFLAEAVGSKSEVAIRDYLLLLREKESERHLLSRHTKLISHADIPAAAEINAEVEIALEEAADAQLAYEEHYEQIAHAQKKEEGLWIINGEVAKRLDAEHDEVEEKLLVDVAEQAKSTFETHIFHVSKFIELSERLFMNYGEESSHNNWRKIAVEGETPAMTKEVVAELYDLAVSLTRKLVQTSLFLAQSRQRATTSSYYTHRAMVKEQDVAAATSVLNLKCDLWDFWIDVPRRNNLDIVHERRHKENAKRRRMPYEVVQQMLSKKKARWRGRRRSNSIGTDTSMTEDEAFDTADNMNTDGSEDSDSETDKNGNSSSFSSDDNPNVFEAHPLDAILDAESSQDSQADPTSLSNESVSLSDEYGGMSFPAVTTRQKRRQMYLEALQDDHLEHIDAAASRAEEARLLELLRREVPVLAKAEYDEGVEAKARPKVLRKSTDDLKDSLEVQNYGAEWEMFGAVVPNDAFMETERARKRRRTATARFSTQATSLRPGTGRTLPIRPRSSSTHSQLRQHEDQSDEELT